ncbi:Pentatricopeptide repeat-containing protein [Platanthera guangdongensis]|uniref:Pentatricopeptide repeat-containing protein n=1 Tax=Platanthera guangdongensis TaxID=2320717 RepID=A0ABR2LCE6_9ASPA
MAFSLIYSYPSQLLPRSLCYSSPTTTSSVTSTLLISQSSSSSSSSQPSIFDYNSLIRAQIDTGRPKHALVLFHRMLAVDALSPDRFTFPTVLKACGHLSAIAEGQQIHSLFLKSHFVPSSDVFVLTSLLHFYACCGRLINARLVFDQMPDRSIASWNAMVDGYARSGDLESAHRLFFEMPDRDIVSWNTLIRGYVGDGRPWEALKIFLDMQLSTMRADDSTMASVIAAVAGLGLLSLGRSAHAYITRQMLPLGGPLGVAMIDMYAKCGSIGSAHTVFLAIKSKRVEHWTAMIAGFAAHGFADASLKVFHEMMNSGTSPNHITFIAVLNACSHGGLVYQGLEYFKLLKVFDIEPRIHHYGCLVDLLGRAGLVDEAAEIVRGMPVDPGSVIWSTLLAACKKHGRADMGKVAAGKTIGLDSSSGGSHVLLSNLYAELGRREESRSVRKEMEDRALRKIAGLSWIEIDGCIHEFVSGDGFHYRAEEIYGVLEDMMRSYLRRVEDHESSSSTVLLRVEEIDIL